MHHAKDVEIDLDWGSGFACVPVLIDAGILVLERWFSPAPMGKSIAEVPEVIHVVWITCGYVVVKVSLHQGPAWGGPPNMEEHGGRRVAKGG